ncbi:hypothetical protein [Rhodoflexus sp.]
MRITIEANTPGEITLLTKLFQELGINRISVEDNRMPVVKGDKRVASEELFGILHDYPRTIEEIRQKAWRKNWHGIMRYKHIHSRL